MSGTGEFAENVATFLVLDDGTIVPARFSAEAGDYVPAHESEEAA